MHDDPQPRMTRAELSSRGGERDVERQGRRARISAVTGTRVASPMTFRVSSRRVKWSLERDEHTSPQPCLAVRAALEPVLNCSLSTANKQSKTRPGNSILSPARVLPGICSVPQLASYNYGCFLEWGGPDRVLERLI